MKDLTWMQVGAGALAAATALFFSSSIGIAGTVLGAAVGSVVTTFSSTIYKSFLTASDSAIKKKIGLEAEEGAGSEAGAETGSPGDAEDAEETLAGPVGAHSEAAVAAAAAGMAGAAGTGASVTGAAGTGATGVAVAGAATASADAATAVEEDTSTGAFATEAVSAFPAVVNVYDSVGADPDATSVFIAARAISRENARAERRRLAELRRVRNLADRRKERRAQQLIAGVSLVTGVVAVAVCAAVILVATNGNGLGRMPQPDRSGEPAPIVREAVTEAAESVGNGQVAAGSETNEQVEQAATEPSANEATTGENSVASSPAEGGQAGTTTTTPSSEAQDGTTETTPAPSEGQEGDGSTGGSESGETGGSTGTDGGSGDSGEGSGTESEGAADVATASTTEA